MVGGVVVDDTLRNADGTLERAVLSRSVGCVQCGYDLRGLRVGGPCPECGCEIWKTVQHLVDPASRLLPRVRHPRKVGNAIVLIVVCLLVASLLMFARPVALTIASFGRGGVAASVSWPPAWYGLAAGGLVLVALAAVAQLAPPADAPEASVRGDLRLLAIGHVVLGGGILASVLAETTMGRVAAPPVLVVLREIAVVGAVVLMVALRRVLILVGERSRAFRTSRGGRQRIREMIAAVAGIGIGLLVHFVGVVVPERAWPFSSPDREAVAVVGSVVIWISALMLVIGLLYLAVNAWWIRRSLLAPPPTLRELLAVSDEAP